MNSINVGGTNTPTEPIDPTKPGDIIKTENGIKYTSDGEWGVIPVPEGFTYTGEGTKKTGFVIKNDTDGNEFVWIPTDLVTYQTYEWSIGDSPDKFTEYYTADETQNAQIIQGITESVNTNKGYYISRYEAGSMTKRSKGSASTTPVFRATSVETPIYAYNYIGWDAAISLGNNLYNKSADGVTSRLINGRGWDTAVKFIETIGPDNDETYPIDGTGKCWSADNSDDNPNAEIGKSVDITNATIPNRIKNIYDLAGNMKEWVAGVYKTPSFKEVRRWLF